MVIRCDYIKKSKSTVGLTTIRDLKENNYNSNDKTNLFNNIKNTEIDIVIETPRYLLIGEAKDEMSFGANSDLCLAHQLIRQYVTARVLIEIQNLDVEVIPFIVGNNLNNNSQVHLMQYLGYLKSENVYTWSNIINSVNLEIFNRD